VIGYSGAQPPVRIVWAWVLGVASLGATLAFWITVIASVGLALAGGPESWWLIAGVWIGLLCAAPCGAVLGAWLGFRTRRPRRAVARIMLLLGLPKAGAFGFMSMRSEVSRWDAGFRDFAVLLHPFFWLTLLGAALLTCGMLCLRSPSRAPGTA